MNEKVQAYAGSLSPETPRSLAWRGQTYLVQTVLERWREVNKLRFLVLCQPDETIFELTFLPEKEIWQVKHRGIR